MANWAIGLGSPPASRTTMAAKKSKAPPAAAADAAEKAAKTGKTQKSDGAIRVEPTAFTKEEEFKAYRDMLLIRRFEEKAGQMYGMGLIGGFCHLYIGQEAVVVGMQITLKRGDQVITGYRDHGH